MEYLEENDIPLLVRVIVDQYGKREQVPDYLSERDGIRKLLGVFEGAKQDIFYGTVIEKAAYIFIQINKGHFFSNGNKRLSLVCGLVFLGINDLEVSGEVSKLEYEQHLNGISSTESLEDDPTFSPEEFALYNLAILIAESNKSNLPFDDLKRSVIVFLSKVTVPYKE